MIRVAEPGARAGDPDGDVHRQVTFERNRTTMDVQTIDQSYQQLQDQSQQTIAALSRLSQKLQNAIGGGDHDAREWQLDLCEIAVGI